MTLVEVIGVLKAREVLFPPYNESSCLEFSLIRDAVCLLEEPFIRVLINLL